LKICFFDFNRSYKCFLSLNQCKHTTSIYRVCAIITYTGYTSLVYSSLILVTWYLISAAIYHFILHAELSLTHTMNVGLSLMLYLGSNIPNLHHPKLTCSVLYLELSTRSGPAAPLQVLVFRVCRGWI
jgi:hypothetical protein